MKASVSVTERPVPGGWTRREIQLADRCFQLILPSDPDRMLEGCIRVSGTKTSQREAAPDPYWASLWPAAMDLSGMILRSDFKRGTEALELGCGAGLAGLAALAKGLQVTFNDHVELAVALALENASLNGLHACRGSVFDWRRHPREAYSLILASDVLYERTMHRPLIQLLQVMLADDGCCWIGDPGRNHIPLFLERAVANGFTVDLRDKGGRALARPHYGQFQLIRLERSKASSRVV